MKKRTGDEMYFSYLTPNQRRFEKFLNAFYIFLMIATFVGSFLVAVASPQDTEMTFLGMVMCELCLYLMRRFTIPLHEIQFTDYQKKPEVKLRDNVVLAWVGLGFLCSIGYLMVAVGLVNYLNSL